MVLQVPTAVRNDVMALLRAHGLSRHAHFIGKPNDRGVVEVWRDTKLQFGAPLQQLHQVWDEVSWRIAALRDHPACADAEHAAVGQADDPGLHVHLSFDPVVEEQAHAAAFGPGASGTGLYPEERAVQASELMAPGLLTTRPKVAVLREQGVNSHVEMAWVFDQAGFEAWDVHRAARFVDHHGRPTEAHPFNPNGSPEGLTAVTTADGRFTAMMPHPERVFRELQMSWSSRDASALSPWMQMFRNARRWVG